MFYMCVCTHLSIHTVHAFDSNQYCATSFSATNSPKFPSNVFFFGAVFSLFTHPSKFIQSHSTKKCFFQARKLISLSERVQVLMGRKQHSGTGFYKMCFEGSCFGTFSCVVSSTRSFKFSFFFTVHQQSMLKIVVKCFLCYCHEMTCNAILATSKNAPRLFLLSKTHELFKNRRMVHTTKTHVSYV